MERTHFRLLFWQKLVPLVPLPVFAMMLYITPFTQGWSFTTWIGVGVVTGCAVLAYVLVQWLHADVILDADGVTFYGVGGRQTWPHEKLLKTKDIGRFRARMCYDPDVPDKHMHISFDLFRRDAFVDALLDWYEETTAHELADAESNEEAAAA